MSCQYPPQYATSPNGPGSPGDNSCIKLGHSTFFNGPPHNLSNLPQQPPRQKGRPRKRKPKDIEALTASLGKMFF